jgi:hypothetical protein
MLLCAAETLLVTNATDHKRIYMLKNKYGQWNEQKYMHEYAFYLMHI